MHQLFAFFRSGAAEVAYTGLHNAANIPDARELMRALGKIYRFVEAENVALDLLLLRTQLRSVKVPRVIVFFARICATCLPYHDKLIFVCSIPHQARLYGMSKRNRGKLPGKDITFDSLRQLIDKKREQYEREVLVAACASDAIARRLTSLVRRASYPLTRFIPCPSTRVAHFALLYFLSLAVARGTTSRLLASSVFVVVWTDKLGKFTRHSIV